MITVAGYSLYIWLWKTLRMGIIIWFIGLFTSFAQIAIRHYKFRNIPGPKREGFLHGHILTISRIRNTEGHINDWFYSLSKLHGDVFVFWVYNLPKVVLSNAKYARSLLTVSGLPKSHCQSPFAVFNEISSESMLDGCGYSSILTDPGSDRMLERRRVYLKSLRISNMHILIDPVLQVTDEMIMKLNIQMKDLDKHNMKHYICLFVHDCISEALFGLEGASFNNKNILFNFFVKAETASKNVIQNKRKTDYKLYQAEVSSTDASTEVMEIRRLIYEHVQITKQLLRRRNNSKRISESNMVFPDLISSILDSEDDVQEVNDEEIVNDVVSMFLMGRETLTSALIQVLHQILSDRAVYIRLIAEIELLLGTVNQDITFDTINKLSYLDAVIKETLRLFPSIPATRKKISRRKFVGKYKLEKTITIISTYNIHRDPTIWKDPEKFNPDRFMDKRILYPCELFPFSFGPRTCIGAQFSVMCMKVFIVKLFRMFDVRRVEEGRPLKYTDYISLRLDSDIPCVLKKTRINEITFPKDMY